MFPFPWDRSVWLEQDRDAVAEGLVALDGHLTVSVDPETMARAWKESLTPFESVIPYLFASGHVEQGVAPLREAFARLSDEERNVLDEMRKVDWTDPQHFSKSMPGDGPGGLAFWSSVYEVNAAMWERRPPATPRPGPRATPNPRA